jgi:hypothetical protein
MQFDKKEGFHFGHDREWKICFCQCRCPCGNPEQGVVLVRHYDEQRIMRNSNIVKTPKKSGMVTIAGYDGMILTLATKDGNKLTFDVATEKFK